ncbi:thioredoxin-disulfide reductase [Patescibacteria group bacterium]|nr:thioredoxin-disulfide reductase [Patescibacteria group bacterium]
MEKVIIIGSGPAGMTAGIYLGRAFLNPLIFSGSEPGGQLIYTTKIENFPGFPDGIVGSELMINIRKQTEKFGAKFVDSVVKSVNFSQKPYKIIASDQEYEAESVIIATGARSRMLGLPNEDKLLSKGVHTCATCDGAFYRDKDVLIVGGGDTAMEDASFICKFAKNLYLANRSDKFSASEIMQKKVINNPKIKIFWDTGVKEYVGDDTLKSVKLGNNKTGKTQELKIDGVFLAIGNIPNTELFKGQIDLDDHNYIKVKDRVFTNKEGIFVAGDVADWKYRQAVTAAGLGCMAALEAEKYLTSLE